MHLLPADAATGHVDGLLHLDTQRASAGLDLTVGALFALNDPGALDFGGSEFEPASRTRLDPSLAHPDDDYGWWTLEAGTYAVEYNESVPMKEEVRVGFVFPLKRLMMAGARHPAFCLTESRDSLETLLTVGGAGCRIKENSRISRLLLYAE